MRHQLWGAVSGLCLAALLTGPVAASDLKGKPVSGPAAKQVKDSTPTCGKHGTTVEFLDTPQAAAKQAKKEGKLVFVLHVSGNFEDPRFT